MNSHSAWTGNYGWFCFCGCSALCEDVVDWFPGAKRDPLADSRAPMSGVPRKEGVVMAAMHRSAPGVSLHVMGAAGGPVRSRVEAGSPAGALGAAVGGPVVLVGLGGVGEVPMRMPVGVCGLTVTGVELVGGVAVSFTGRWRGEYGPASRCVGDVVLDLVEPSIPLDPRQRSNAREARRVRVLMCAATPRRWLWLADARDVGIEWPYLLAPLAMIALGQGAIDARRHPRARI